MAPEVQNANYGREIDIYALGLVLLEICILRDFNVSKCSMINDLRKNHFYDLGADVVGKLENEVDEPCKVFLSLYRKMTHNDPSQRPLIGDIFNQLQQIQTVIDTNDDITMEDSDITLEDNSLNVTTAIVTTTLILTLSMILKIDEVPARCILCTLDKSVTLIQVDENIRQVLSRFAVDLGNTAHIHICSNCLIQNFTLSN